MAGRASGGLSSGTGIVDAASGLLGAPHLKAEELVAANPGCIDLANNTLVIPSGGQCVFDFKDSVDLDRRMVLRDGVTPGKSYAPMVTLVNGGSPAPAFEKTKRLETLCTNLLVIPVRRMRAWLASTS